MSWTSQIEGPSPSNTYGFKVTQVNLQNAKALHEVTDALNNNNNNTLFVQYHEQEIPEVIPFVNQSK